MQYFLHYVEMPANDGIFIKFGEHGHQDRLRLYKTYNPLITNVNFKSSCQTVTSSILSKSKIKTRQHTPKVQE